MGLKKLSKEIKEGLPRPCYFIHAKEYFFITRTVEKIKSLIPEDQLSFNLHTFDFSERGSDFQEIIDSANSPGFFQNRKFIILFHFEKARKKEKEVLYGYLKDPSPDTTIVVFSEKPAEAEIKKLLKPEQVISLDLNHREMKHWIKAVASDMGLKLSGEITDLLFTLCNGNAGIIYSELEKLSLLGRKSPEFSEIAEVISGSVSQNAFALAELIVKRRKKESFMVLESLQNENEPIALIGALNWKIADLQRRGHIKDKKRFKQFLEILIDTDRKLKNSQTVGVLEEAIIKLLQT